MISSTRVSDTKTYSGTSEINFIREEEGLTVTIDTDDLHIRSVRSSESDLNSYVSLFGDPIVMEKYGPGKTNTKDEMQTRIQGWVKRWQEMDPYSGLAILKKDTDEFLGHVIIGHGVDPGEGVLAYLIMKQHWNKHIATNAVTPVVKEFAPATVQEGFTLEGKTLEKITATARIDNPYSVKILEKTLKMHEIKKAEKWDALRNYYSIDLCELAKKV